MGLAKDLQNVFKNVMGFDDIEDDITKKTIEKKSKQLGEEMSGAIIKWIKKQEFNITEMKAIVQLEKLNTTGDLSADVKSRLKGEIPIGNVLSRKY